MPGTKEQIKDQEQATLECISSATGLTAGATPAGTGQAVETSGATNVHASDQGGSIDGALTEAEYVSLASRWIGAATADLSGIRRVDSAAGRFILGQHGHGHDSYGGLSIPSYLPRGWSLGAESVAVARRRSRRESVAL